MEMNRSRLEEAEERLDHRISIREEEKKWHGHSIYKLPQWWPEIHQNTTSYKPRVVSFGPYHHGRPHLQAMEEHKLRALVHFVSRTQKPIGDYLEALREKTQDLMGHYEKLGNEWRRDEEKFLELMMVDGCFMLEILYYLEAHISEDVSRVVSDYAANDPIFSAHGQIYNIPYIKGDMLMMENQIPLLVLEQLVKVERGRSEYNNRLHKLVSAGLLDRYEIGRFWDSSGSDMALGLHVLDVVRKGLLLMPPRYWVSGRPDSRTYRKIPSAIQLKEAGIRFESRKEKRLRPIEFKDGILHLPMVVAADSTELIFLNLMAFERLHTGAGNEVTSYVYFMRNLINSPIDVDFLHRQNIIDNTLGSDEEVANLFSQLMPSKIVAFDLDADLDDLYADIERYCLRRCSLLRANRHLVDLRRAYLNSPWTFISLVAGVFLLSLTFLQTLYTIIQYYHQNPIN